MSRASMMITMFALLCPSMLAADCQNQPEGCIDQPQDEVKMLQVREAEVVGPPDVTKYVEPAAVATARATATWAVNNAETARLEKIADAKAKKVDAKIAKIAANSAAATKQKYANKVAKATAHAETARNKNNQASNAKTAAAAVKTIADAANTVAIASNTTASTNAAYAATQAATVAAAVTASQTLADTAKVAMENTVNTKSYDQSVLVAGKANVKGTAAAQSALVSRVLTDYDDFLKKQKNAASQAANVVLKDTSKNQSNAVSINMQANKAAARAAQQANKYSQMAAPVVTCATYGALGFEADGSASTTAQVCVAVGAGFPGVLPKADQANSPCPTGVCRKQDCCDDVFCILPAIDITQGRVTGTPVTSGGTAEEQAAATAANNAACLQTGNGAIGAGIDCTVSEIPRTCVETVVANGGVSVPGDAADCAAVAGQALNTPAACIAVMTAASSLNGLAPSAQNRACTYAGGVCTGAPTGACTGGTTAATAGTWGTAAPACTAR